MRSHWLPVFPLVACLWAVTAWADVYCPSCGTRYPDSYHYCPKDGFNLDEARKAAAGGPAAGPASPAASPSSWPDTSTSGTVAAPAAPSSEAWASELPIHLPIAYPDANTGDFALLEWIPPDPARTSVYLRVVLNAGKKGNIDVLSMGLPWPKKKASDPPPTLQQVLSKVSTSNAKRQNWSDYRDFATSFEAGGRPLLSPFVGGNKPLGTSRKNCVTPAATVGCDVTEYSVQRDGRSVKHVIRMSEQVPYAFVESTYEGLNERMAVYLFGTIDEDDLGPLERMFPRKP